jgi:signal transduction histidine kinase/transcriptional regulator with PAS, ATPase and Fis domain
MIVALAIGALTAAILWQLEQGQLDNCLADVSALDLLVAAQTERAFENVGVMLGDISADVQAEGIASVPALRQAMGGEATFRLLRAKMAGVPQLDALAIGTADGDVVNRTDGYPVAPAVNLAQREYFVRLRDHPEIKAYVSPPLQSGPDGQMMIYIGKRLNAPNGAFLGVVLGAIRLDYVQGLYADYIEALAGTGKSMALWRNDGTLLVRMPAAGDDASVDVTPPDLSRPAPRNGLLSFWNKDQHGNSVGVAQRRLDDFPLTVEARQSASAMLADWNSEILGVGAASAGLLLLEVIAVWLLLRQLRAAALVAEERARADREAEAREDIERAMAKAEAAMRDAQQSEARFRDIAEVGSDWIWETDAQHRFTMIAGARRPKVDLIGKTRWEQSGADPESDAVWRQHKAVLDAHQPFRQFRFATMAGNSRFDVCVSGKPIFDDDGTFIGYRGTVSDETELVDARERAIRADSLLRNAIESIAEGFVIYDADDRFVMCNDAYRKMYPENASGFVPGATYEQIMREALATGRYPDATGREEQWLAERLRKHREAVESEENRLADGRWVMRSERRMADGGIAGLRIDITALKAAQESLHESQVMLNRAQRLSGTGSVVRNLKTNATEWSDEMYRIMGVQREGFTPNTESFVAMIHPEDRARVADVIAQGPGIASEPPMQFRIVRTDGTVRCIHREADFWCDPDGRPAARLATYKDITEQHAAEMRNRELEILLRDAIESISEGFVIYDAEDRLVLCNEAFRNLYPNSADHLVPGTRYEDILRAAAYENGAIPRDRADEWLAQRLRQHRELKEPVELQLEDGRWLLISERRTSSGGTAGLRVDITALKRVQQSLHDSQQRLDRTQKIAHIGTVERNLRTQKVIWSDETYRIFGVNRDTYKPSFDNLLALVQPEDRPLLLAVLRRRDHEHANSKLKFRITRPDGENRILFSQADIVRDEAGTPLFISIAMMDITDQEVAGQRQLELETQLRHSEKLTALGTLAGGIAHDLNNTLVPIQALSKMVMQDMPRESVAHADLETIYQASIQARDLVRQILAFSRKEDIAHETTDISAKVHEALQMLRASVPASIELIERIDAVPPILADGTQLLQVVVNLVTNGAHAIGDRQGRVTVTLDQVPGDEGRIIRLSVADTGCGISPEIMHRMFEPFFTTKEVGEGTGLGLSVVHGIVTAHGGSIDVHSKPGEGTEFVILLPAKTPGAATNMAAVA